LPRRLPRRRHGAPPRGDQDVGALHEFCSNAIQGKTREEWEAMRLRGDESRKGDRIVICDPRLGDEVGD
jgi:hypothetical protein